MARRWSFLVPLPPRAASSNRSAHGAKKSPDVLAYRLDVVRCVREQAAGQPWPLPAAPLERAVLTLSAGYSRRKPRKVDGAMPAGWLQWQGRYRPTDASNLIAGCKALQDALCCRSHNPGDVARLVVDDCWPHLTTRHGEPPFVEVPDWRDEGVFVVLEEVA